MFSKAIQIFKIFRHLNLSDLAKLKRISTLVNFKEGEMIAHQGDRYRYIIAIRKGIIRTFEIKSDGEERTTRLAADGEMTSCSACFMEDKPSREYLQAVEDCKVILISIYELRKLIDQNYRFQKLYNEGITEAMVEAIDRIRFFIMLTPEERYLKLMTEAPKLIQRVPQKYLASYMGITTVSLSRIRKRLSESSRNK